MSRLRKVGGLAFKRPVVTGVVVALVAVTMGGGLLAWHVATGRSLASDAALRAGNHALNAEVPTAASPAGTPTASPTLVASPTPTAVSSLPPAAATAPPAAHFATLPPGVQLPSSAQCAGWVEARAIRENKPVNAAANQTTGHRLTPDFLPASDDPRANSQMGARVDGAFRGTTRQILRWAACKWGIDEDIVYAQAAKESWWHQPNLGDWGADASGCAPGHGLGADGRPGVCPQSFGILQNRYPYERGSWPGIGASTAMNADTAYAIWRVCYEGWERWLNDVERGSQYGAGDAWGCVGRWFSGRWHTAPSDEYSAAVRDYLNQRIWEQGNFQEA